MVLKTIAVFMNAHLKDNRQVHIRLLRQEDEVKLAAYIAGLSPETRKRSGPHSFDASTVHLICANLEKDDTKRYVEATPDGNQLVAFMLIKNGILENGAGRLRSYGIQLTDHVFTFAASIADGFQSSGLGSVMPGYILEGIPPRKIILWGGVQASNDRAVKYYTKFGFYKVGIFEDDNGTNFDMIRQP